jgi:hypothetical protein
MLPSSSLHVQGTNVDPAAAAVLAAAVLAAVEWAAGEGTKYWKISNCRGRRAGGGGADACTSIAQTVLPP